MSRGAAGKRNAVKVRRITGKLEQVFGIPVPRPDTPPPLDMLIATILSQNTNDRNSHRAYIALRKKFPAWENVLASRQSSIASAIRTGGMAGQKSRCIKSALAEIHKQFGTLSLSGMESLSDDEVLAKLSSFKGVGVKTAACVLLFSLHRNVCPVDTHVHRVSARLAINNGGKTPEKTFYALRPLVPAEKAYSLHNNLIRFGRKFCHSSKPLCGECPLYRECGDPIRFGRRKSKGGGTKDVGFMVLENL